MESQQLLTILLDIQKQLGDANSVLSAHTVLLSSLDDRVALANSKTAKNILDIQTIKDEKNVFKGKNYVITIIVSFLSTITMAVIINFLNKRF